MNIAICRIRGPRGLTLLLLAACKAGDPPIDAVDSAPEPSACFSDLDGDGFGAGEAIPLDFCVPGTTALDGDCDPDRGESWPGAAELCDRLDNDCDGLVDDHAIDGLPWYADGDGDGFGSGEAVFLCEPPTGYGAVEGDCQEGDAAIYPGAPERCDGVDEDCDGAVDESPIDGLVAHADGDGDGFGDAATARHLCALPVGEVTDGTDCDDGDPAVFPGAAEADCDDARDYNCDGSAGLSDVDQDGFPACRDCLDSHSEVHAGALERCNNLDDDCDGETDPPSALDAAIWYSDGDGDGWGASDAAQRACAAPAGAVEAEGDCLDTDARVFPGAAEVCDDGLDNDCDGSGNGCGVYGVVNLGLYADISLLGEYPFDYAGAALAAGEDLTGDGQPDILIGAPYSSLGAVEGGAVYLVSPQASAPSLATAAAVLTGESTDDLAGGAVAMVGDVNGDGAPDALVGAPYDDDVGSGSGAAYLWFGPISGTISLASADLKFTGVSESSLAGFSVAGAGDVNGDGIADMLIGARGYSPMYRRFEGGVHLLLSPLDGASGLDAADALFVGEESTDHLGEVVAGVGDLDGDGLDDVAASAPGAHRIANYGGTVYIFCGAYAGAVDAADATARVSGAQAGAGLGSAVQALGDDDGDGYGDLVIGASGDSTYDTAGGAAYVFYGPLFGDSTHQDAAIAFYGPIAQDLAGEAIATRGDLDGDGFADLAVGAPFNSTTGSSPGRVYVAYGPLIPGAYSLSDVGGLVTGGPFDVNVGASLSFGGDIDGDGLDDLVIGAPASDAAWSQAGAVYALFGGEL